ncbi:MAG: AI-2E family transporter [Burkholderiaceae bacterium]
MIGVVLIAVAAVITFDGVWQWVLMPGLYFLCTAIEGQFITPWLLGRQLNLTPVAILLAVAFWAWMWGFAGAVVAVPILVVAKSICEHTGVLAWFPRLYPWSSRRSRVWNSTDPSAFPLARLSLSGSFVVLT